MRVVNVDPFWPIKLLAFAGLCVAVAVVLMPQDICFTLDEPQITDGVLVQQNTSFHAINGKAKVNAGEFCIHMDVWKHFWCTTRRLTTNPDDVCLMYGRELTTVMSQLLSAIFVDVLSSFFLWKAIRDRNLTTFHITVPLLQIAMIVSVVIIHVEMALTWSSIWSYVKSSDPIPSHPYHVLFPVGLGLLVLEKLCEALVIYRTFMLNGNNAAVVLKEE